MDFSAALSVLHGLMQTEGSSSGTANQMIELPTTAATILSAKELSANATSFWQATAEANISINALSRCGHLPSCCSQDYLVV